MSTRPATPPSTARAAINDAAVRLFGQQSYTATSMRDIAKAVGVLPGSLYAHISSKEELLFDIVDAGVTDFLNAVAPFAGHDASPQIRMRGAIKAHVAEAAANPERSLVVFHQWRFLTAQALADAMEKRRRYERIFLSILDGGIADGTFEPTINKRVAMLAILGALNWVPEWYSAKGSATPDELGEIMADTLLGGILAKA